MDKKVKVKKDHSKASKAMGLTAAFLIILPCLVLTTFGILDLAGVFPLLGERRTYTIEFFAEETLLDSIELKRGDKIVYDYEPYKIDYKFIGWDIDGNKIPDVLPARIYYNITARAVWSKII